MTRSAPPPGLMRERLERQAEQRPDKPARKLGDVLKVPKVTPTTKRLIDAHAEIIDGPADDIAFSHSVLCQTSLPYRPTDERVWIRDQGHVSLLIEAGAARHPDTGKWVELPLPHGEKPRLVMLHLNGEALRTGSPIIDVEGSMTAFVRALGIHTNGRNIRTLRDQLARLAAAHIMLGIGSTTIKTDVIDAFDLWWPDDAKQRIHVAFDGAARAPLLRQPDQARRPARQPGRCRAGALGAGPRHLRLACPTPAPHPQGQAADDHMAGAQVAVRCRTMTGCATSGASSCRRSRPS